MRELLDALVDLRAADRRRWDLKVDGEQVDLLRVERSTITTTLPSREAALRYMQGLRAGFLIAKADK